MPGDSARPHGITVLCVEDHPVFREGLRTIIESQDDMRLVAQATTAVEAVDAFRQHQPDVTLLDVRLAGSDGIDALARIRQEFPRARVLVLSTSDVESDITRALRSGAAGYLLKSAPFSWAIANLYRNGDDRVRAELESAYRDAKKRPETLKHFKGAAEEHVNGEKIYMGDIHGPARSYARSHIVVPGDRRYLQSLDEYLKTKGGK